ncbi:MAG: pyridoxal phosphate-dependent aminotransferase [Nannocystaceae bacterium]
MSEPQPDPNVVSDHVADVLLGAKESWTRRMFELATQLRADGGGPVYDLSLGNPSLEPPQCWRDTVRALLEDEPAGQHRYMTSAGFPEVRAFIAKREAARYGLPVGVQDVTMTVGAAGGLNVFLRSTVNPGESVLVPAPYFPEYEHYCAHVGAKLVPVATHANFTLDLDRIEAALEPSTRVLLLNSPNNPTGAVYSENSLRDLAQRLSKHNKARKRALYVVEDSPYRDLTYDGSDAPSMLRHYGNTVFLTSHSKDLGLAGERIGYIVVSPGCRGRELLSRAISFNNRVLGFVNAPALMQRALPAVLNDPGGRVDVSVYADSTRKMAEGLSELGFEIPPPRAGFFLFPRLSPNLSALDSRGGDVALTERLREHRTIVVPGTAFGVAGHLRLSLCVESEVVDGALRAFRRVCAA